MRRRLVLVMMMVTVAACGLSGDDAGGDGTGDAAPGADCAPGQADGDLNLYNWSEYIDPALIDQFEQELEVSVTETFYDSNETMLAQIDAGGAAYDLVVPSDYMVQTMIEAELLVPLNPDALEQHRQHRSRVHRAALRSRRHLLGAVPVGHHRARASRSSWCPTRRS